METVICHHDEVVNSATHIGKCKICGQERFYDPETPGKFKVLKRGSINGKVTEIVPPKKGSRVPAESSPTSFKPADWNQLTKYQKSIFHNENKDYILKTVSELGMTKALKKLDIHPATFYRLLTRWGIDPKDIKKKKPRKITGQAQLVEAKRVTKEPDPRKTPSAPLRTGVRVIRRF